MLLKGGLFGHYIKWHNIEELKNYKYTSGGSTYLEKVLNWWWEFVVTLIPTWIAPNVLTLLGFSCAMLSFVLVLVYSPTLTEPAPSWTYFCIAALMFVYQTFASLTSLGVTCSGVGLRQYLVVIFSTQLIQYIYMTLLYTCFMPQWWEYHFHVFFSSTGPIGVTEAQIVMILLCIISGIFGPQTFGIDLLSLFNDTVKESLKTWIPFLEHLLIREVMMLVLIVMNVLVSTYDVVLGLARAKQRLLATGQMGSFLVFMVCQWVFYKSCLLGDSVVVYSALVYFIMSSTYSIIVIRLCLSVTCKFPFTPFQWPTIPFYVVVALLYYGPHLGVEYLVVGENKDLLILVLTVWNFVYIWDLLVTSISDICSQLNINCFVTSHKPIEKLQ